MVWITILSTLFVINAILLIIIVLMQNRGGAEVGIFGGSNLLNPFGSRAGDVLSKTTSILAASFIIIALLISVAVSKSSVKVPLQKPQSVQQEIPQQPQGQLPQQQLPTTQ
ncbi:MAG: preprotein translocase subunit SecG [Brevinematia bacterium]